MTGYVGIHTSIYLTQAELDEILTDAKRVALVAFTGVDIVRPLERFALDVLKSSGRLP